MKTTKFLNIILFVCLAASAAAQDEPDNPWPREILIARGIVIVYQPQPDTLDGNQVAGRSAVALDVGDTGDMGYSLYRNR